MKKTAMILTVSSLFFVSAISISVAEEPPLKKAAQNQKHRIEQGIKSGELTPQEAKRLEAEQVKLKNAEAEVKSDGEVTNKERKILKNRREKASQHIYNLKHNKKDAN